MHRIDLDILEKFKKGDFDYYNDNNYNEKEYFRRFNALFLNYVNEKTKVDPIREQIIVHYLLTDKGYTYLQDLRRVFH